MGWVEGPRSLVGAGPLPGGGHVHLCLKVDDGSVDRPGCPLVISGPKLPWSHPPRGSETLQGQLGWRRPLGFMKPPFPHGLRPRAGPTGLDGHSWAPPPRRDTLHVCTVSLT